jgi:lipopolysaccharide/colanic/teichoic acid biosynthesis glycosyltransferase
VLYNHLTKEPDKYDFILSVSGLTGVHGLPLKETIHKLGFSHIPFFLVVDKADNDMIQTCIRNGITDIFIKPLDKITLRTRLDFQLKHPVGGWKKRKQEDKRFNSYKMPFIKRVFDLLVAGTILLILSPLFLIVALLIRLESKGPVFYYSYRVGTGYNIFKFYKFRSMFTGADAKLQQLKHLNQYSTEKQELSDLDPERHEVKELCEFCEQAGGGCLQSLYDDNQMVCEKIFSARKKSDKESAFIKIKDDPRVTKVGKFIRNTSIDELPQLWNVIKGDMSLVGNRPLPLYEAEKITTDKYSLRFLGPAGITGLWQVEKRGRGEMSEEERLSLDNDYVKNFSVWFDLKILLRTIPALFQSENV